MRHYYFLSLAFIPFLAISENYGCATVGASMEISLFDSLRKDLGIDTSLIQRNKTKVVVLGTSPVSELYAEKLAKADYKESREKGTMLLLESEFFESYYDNYTRSITAKYTYFNKENKKDVFIATSLMNKDECSIRFNGYITLSREF